MARSTPRVFSLAWLHNHPSPNQMEFFHALGENKRVRLRAMNCSSGWPDRPFPLGEPWLEDASFSFDYEVLPGRIWRLPGRKLHFNPRIVRRILGSSPETLWIVSGYTDPTMQLAMWTLLLGRRKWFLVNEAPLKTWGGTRNILRRMLLLPVQMGSRGVVVYGSNRMAQYFWRVVGREKVVAVAQYQNLAPLIAIERENSPRTDSYEVKFFYAGRLEPFTGVATIVRAFNEVGSLFSNTRLEILGEGSQRDYLKSLVDSKVIDRVRFVGTVSRDQVPGIFQRNDVFVQPNFGQGWGMAVNEAMASGMPIISSRAVGAAEALIEHGSNGFLLERPDDVDGFRKYMAFFAEKPDRVRAFGRTARRTALGISLTTGVEEFLKLVEAIDDAAYPLETRTF